MSLRLCRFVAASVSPLQVDGLEVSVVVKLDGGLGFVEVLVNTTALQEGRPPEPMELVGKQVRNRGPPLFTLLALQ